jgi:hypothetical protein
MAKGSAERLTLRMTKTNIMNIDCVTDDPMRSETIAEAPSSPKHDSVLLWDT